MARILRSTLPDGYFHVYTRGVADTSIFRDDEDRRWFLALFLNAARRSAWELHTLCLMTTHYHVVLQSTRAHLSAGMQWLNGLYAQSFNRRYDREGHLFGARSDPAKAGKQLRHVCGLNLERNNVSRSSGITAREPVW